MKLLPKTLFGRLFLLIFGFMLSIIVLVKLISGVLIGDAAGQPLAIYSQAMILFAQEINRLGTADSNRRFAERLQQNTGMILLQNTSEQFDTIPNMPIYKRWEDALSQFSGNEVTMSYQTEQWQELVWLHHQKSPQFSLGLPAVINRNLVKHFFIISVLVTAVLSLFSAYVATYFLSRSLKELAEKARLIGQDIDSIAIKPSGPKEVQDVAIAMNKMRADLEAMNKKQKFLLASISHDLRTPLTRIHIATQLLAPDTKGFIQGINEDIDEMNEVLHRFIELARFNIEETESWQIGDIAIPIREAAEKYQHSGAVIILTLGDTPRIRYKLKALQSYLYNLINNSIKHGAGNITISSQTRGNCVELCVSDQGSGFSMSPKELIAYSDFNVDHNTVNGLGLRIVQLIANMHDADLTLRNKLEGGAEVKLNLKAYIDLG